MYKFLLIIMIKKNHFIRKVWEAWTIFLFLRFIFFFAPRGQAFFLFARGGGRFRLGWKLVKMDLNFSAYSRLPKKNFLGSHSDSALSTNIDTIFCGFSCIKFDILFQASVSFLSALRIISDTRRHSHQFSVLAVYIWLLQSMSTKMEEVCLRSWSSAYVGL